MLKLNYIIIGELPEKQKNILRENLMHEGAGEGKVIELSLEKQRWNPYSAEESLLISSDVAQLREAYLSGTATLGFLDGKERDEQPQADMYAEGFEEVGWNFLQRVYERHHHLPWTILTTERCVVREFSMEYLDALFELYAGEGMTDYIEPLYPYEEEREYQKAYIENMYRFYGYGMWIVCEKETGRLIGRAGIEHREELGGELELGYAIGVPWQRKGYATEVCTAILTYVRDELEFPSVCCLIEEGNTVSEHLAEKLGLGWRGTMELGGKQMRRYVRYF